MRHGRAGLSTLAPLESCSSGINYSDPISTSEWKKLLTEFTLDSIIRPEFTFYQPVNGYRINIDTVILYGFAIQQARGNVLEIGSASGVTGILLSKHHKVTGVTGVEIERSSYEASLKNLELHACEKKVTFINRDINAYKQLFKPQSFHTLITNPPFYRQGTGKRSKKRGTDTARSDGYLTIEDVFKAARYLLKPDGCLIMLFLTCRINDVFLNARGFHIEEIRFVHRTALKPSDVFLMLARKGRGKQLRVIPPLIVHETNGYSKEMISMLNPKKKVTDAEFYHNSVIP